MGAEAKRYLQEHSIPELFEGLMTGLIYNKPKNPVHFLEYAIGKFRDNPETMLKWDSFVDYNPDLEIQSSSNNKEINYTNPTTSTAQTVEKDAPNSPKKTVKKKAKQKLPKEVHSPRVGRSMETGNGTKKKFSTDSVVKSPKESTEASQKPPHQLKPSNPTITKSKTPPNLHLDLPKPTGKLRSFSTPSKIIMSQVQSPTTAGLTKIPGTTRTSTLFSGGLKNNKDSELQIPSPINFIHSEVSSANLSPIQQDSVFNIPSAHSSRGLSSRQSNVNSDILRQPANHSKVKTPNLLKSPKIQKSSEFFTAVETPKYFCNSPLNIADSGKNTPNVSGQFFSTSKAPLSAKSSIIKTDDKQSLKSRKSSGTVNS